MYSSQYLKNDTPRTAKEVSASMSSCSMQKFALDAESIRNEANTEVNPVCSGEHVLVIERHIRYLKDGVHGTYKVLPFEKKKKWPA